MHAHWSHVRLWGVVLVSLAVKLQANSLGIPRDVLFDEDVAQLSLCDSDCQAAQRAVLINKGKNGIRRKEGVQGCLHMDPRRPRGCRTNQQTACLPGAQWIAPLHVHV